MDESSIKFLVGGTEAGEFGLKSAQNVYLDIFKNFIPFLHPKLTY